MVKVFWTDGAGKHGLVLGPAHVKDSGRRTPRGAVIWRRADGPKPTPEHVTPKEADYELAKILADAPRRVPAGGTPTTLREACESHVAVRRATKGLRRSTVGDYEGLHARLYRELGADTPVADLDAARLHELFSGFMAESPIGAQKAERLAAAGVDVARVTNVVLAAWPPGLVPVEVATKAEAVRLAGERGWTWKHRARGVYRVTPPRSTRPRVVTAAEAEQLAGEGWHVVMQEREHWVHRTPAKAQTRNKYRDHLSAVLDTAVARGWRDDNPMRGVPRSSRREDRQRILRREDFYDRPQVERLLAEVGDPVAECFFSLGTDAGFRLPGEALGLRWGAVDFEAGVLRPYDNWVRDQLEPTKTGKLVAIPMTPRLEAALRRLKARGWLTGDEDHVFAADPHSGRPIDADDMRQAFREAYARAGLPAIPMYNTRHSFGTALARRLDLRTISELMRHDRLSTTETYMAYAPRDDLREQMAEGAVRRARDHDARIFDRQSR